MPFPTRVGRSSFPSAMISLVVKGRQGERKAVNDVSFDVHAGENFGIGGLLG
jgi:ABC-type glutathione transport system ATPase component